MGTTEERSREKERETEKDEKCLQFQSGKMKKKLRIITKAVFINSNHFLHFGFEKKSGKHERQPQPEAI